MDTQSRTYQITINNPKDHGFTDDKIESLIAKSRVRFACYAHEIGENGTPHVHIYLCFKSPRRFSTIQKRFQGAHIETAYGNVQDNVDYVQKAGKFAGTDKAETSVADSYREFGEKPSEDSMEFSDMEQVVELLKQGYSTVEIINEFPKYAFKVNAIEAVKQQFLAEKYRETLRPVEVTYKFGATGTGKTRSIYQENAPEDVCRITSYGKNGVKFDAYHGEAVLVLEEYASQIPLEDLLIYLDIYPLTLPARYTDRIACYTKVIITSNLPLEAQYVTEQQHKPESFLAFLRRINYLEEFLPCGKVIRTKLNDVVELKEKDEKDDE